MPEFRLDHVAVAVHAIKPALKLYRDALGGEYLMGGDVGDVGGKGAAGPEWRWLQLRYPGGGKVELLEPLGEGFLSRFLQSRGEGLHHITFKTDDIRTAIEKLEGLGYELVDVNIDREQWKEAFLRPSGAHGTLIQVAQSAAPDEVVKEFLQPSNLDELLS
jgi:methylmalonyl-CoA/ethylmalonyl-CoA epimerase